MDDGEAVPEATPVSRFWWYLALIVLAGLAWRVIYAEVFRRPLLPFSGDAFWYTDGANQVAHFKALRYSPGRSILELFDPQNVLGRAPQRTALHSPLYLVWLAIPSMILRGTSQHVHLLWTCVLGSLTVMMTGLAGREVAGPRVGLIAAALCAAYPNVWVYDGDLLSEPAALFMVATIIYLAFRFRRGPTTTKVALLGFACGLAALARSELVLSAVLVLVPTVLFARSFSLVTRLKWIVVGGITVIIAIAPWVAYNHGSFDHTVILTTEFGQTLTAANCDAVYYGHDIGFKNYGCEVDAFTHAPTHRGMDESDVDEVMRHQATKYIRAHLGRVPVVVAARWGRASGLFVPETNARFDAFFFDRKRWVTHLCLYSYYVILPLAVAGAFVLRAARRGIWVLLAFAVMALISVGITFGQARYRAAVEIPLVILAAVTIDAIARAWRRPTALA